MRTKEEILKELQFQQKTLKDFEDRDFHDETLANKARQNIVCLEWVLNE
jgi:hypothetical protein